MSKKNMNVYIDVAIINYCKLNNLSLSNWICNKFKDEYMELESLIEKLEENKKI